jgi:hypothetical protein
MQMKGISVIEEFLCGAGGSEISRVRCESEHIILGPDGAGNSIQNDSRFNTV